MKLKTLLLVGLASWTNFSLAETSQKYTGFGAGSIDPKIVEQFAPKPNPPEKQIEIEKMLDLRTPSLGFLSRDGKTQYVSWNVTGVFQVWKLTQGSKFPIQLTGGQESTRLLGITDDDKNLIISRDYQGDENPGLFLLDTNTGKIETIFVKAKVQANFQRKSQDGKSLYFSTNEKDMGTYEIYRYDFSSKKISSIHEEKGTWYVSDQISSDDLLLTNLIGTDAYEIYHYNEKTKQKKILLGKGERERFDVSFGKDANEIIVATDKLSDFQTLYLFKNGQFKQISSKINADVNNFYVHRNANKIFYTLNNGGRIEAKVLDLNTLKEIPPPRVQQKNVQIYLGSTSQTGRYTTVAIASELLPNKHYVYDWQTKKLELWIEPSTPEIDTSSFIPANLEHYVAEDGTKIPMYVYRSKECETKACPVVVRFHGGPEAQSTPYFNPTIQLYVKNGFIFVEPNVRGSSGYGRKWLDSDNGPKRLNVVTDIRDASAWIKKNWSKNGETPKIGVMGGSYGGYSVYAAMTMFAGSYDAGSAAVGITNLVSFLENTAPYRRHLRESEYGYLDKDMDALKKLSPITYIDKLKDPLQIVHGLNDPRVPVGEALQFYDKLKEKNIEAEFILFSDEGHGVRSRKNRALSTAHTLNFFIKNLKEKK